MDSEARSFHMSGFGVSMFPAGSHPVHIGYHGARDASGECETWPSDDQVRQLNAKVESIHGDPVTWFRSLGFKSITCLPTTAMQLTTDIHVKFHARPAHNNVGSEYVVQFFHCKWLGAASAALSLTYDALHEWRDGEWVTRRPDLLMECFDVLQQTLNAASASQATSADHDPVEVTSAESPSQATPTDGDDDMCRN